MRKIFTGIFVILNSFILCLNAQETEKNIPAGDKKLALKTLVETMENGDVIIKMNPASDSDLRAKINPKVPPAVIDLMLHIDPKLDVAKFNKAMTKSGIEKEVRIKETMQGCDEYLSGYMSIKRTKFTSNTIKARINAGIPYFIAVYKKTDWLNQIDERSKKRNSAENMKAWQEVLRKDMAKGKISEAVGPIAWGLIWGYSKDTNEYLVKLPNYEFWIQESEIKILAHSLYEVR